MMDPTSNDTTFVLGENGATGFQPGVAANFAASKSSMPSPAMTYDDVFPVWPEVATISNRPEQAIGKWNNKLRVGPRNVTQVIFESSSKNVALKSI